MYHVQRRGEATGPTTVKEDERPRRTVAAWSAVGGDRVAVVWQESYLVGEDSRGSRIWLGAKTPKSVGLWESQQQQKYEVEVN
jgi:hypothetical protein